MNIAQQFEQELTAANSRVAFTIAVDAAPRNLSCRMYQCDALAVSFEVLRLSSAELANTSVPGLERLSRSISSRLTYLLEPIAPIESDTDQCAVQLRSNPPQQDDDGRTYYELLIRRGGELNLVRYRKESGGVRQRVPATVTKEVLLRLVNDLDVALDEFVQVGS